MSEKPKARTAKSIQGSIEKRTNKLLNLVKQAEEERCLLLKDREELATHSAPSNGERKHEPAAPVCAE